VQADRRGQHVPFFVGGKRQRRASVNAKPFLVRPRAERQRFARNTLVALRRQRQRDDWLLLLRGWFHVRQESNSFRTNAHSRHGGPGKIGLVPRRQHERRLIASQGQRLAPQERAVAKGDQATCG